MVSCIFYCFTGTRLEDDEINFLSKLIKNFEGNMRPFVYVYTQAVRQRNIGVMEDRVKEEVSKLGNIEFIPVLAEDYDLIYNKWIKAYGLKDLLKKGVDEIKHNIKCDLFKIRTDEISEDVEKQLKEKNFKISVFKRACSSFLDQKIYADFRKGRAS